MATTARSVRDVSLAASEASHELAGAPAETRDAALRRLAELLGERSGQILEANAADLADERAAALDDALRDRLTLTDERIAAMAFIPLVSLDRVIGKFMLYFDAPHAPDVDDLQLAGIRHKR